jgi:putative transposase
MAYSIDLRERVIEFVELRGGSAAEAAFLFKISERTIYNWLSKKRKTGSLKDAPPKRPWKKLCPKALNQCVEAHPDWTLKEYAQYFQTIPSTICEAFKRLRITRKKRPFSTKNEMKKNARHFWQK